MSEEKDPNVWIHRPRASSSRPLLTLATRRSQFRRRSTVDDRHRHPTLWRRERRDGGGSDLDRARVHRAEQRRDLLLRQHLIEVALLALGEQDGLVTGTERERRQRFVGRRAARTRQEVVQVHAAQRQQVPLPLIEAARDELVQRQEVPARLLRAATTRR